MNELRVQEIAREAVIWRQLFHPNVLPFYGIYNLNDDPLRVCLISPWMENGNIVDFLKRVPDANRTWLVRATVRVYVQGDINYVDQVREIAQGLEYLHTMEPVVVHGDLKGVRHLYISPSSTIPGRRF